LLKTEAINVLIKRRGKSGNLVPFMARDLAYAVEGLSETCKQT
jgi:hypothetical protein